MARAVLRSSVTTAATQARDEAGFFAQLRESGVLVRLRYSEINPGEVTGYAVALPGHTEQDGTPRWYGGGRLATGLTLPRLRQGWNPGRSGARPQGGAFRFTGPERDAFYRHAARDAGAAAEQIRRSAGGNPAAAADAAWAAAAAFHATARAIRDPALRRAADSYDRAARAAYGKIPHRTTEGDRLRAAARLLSMIGSGEGDSVTPALAASLVRLAEAVGELRQAQQHAAQAAAARQAAERLYAAFGRAKADAAALRLASQARQAGDLPKPGNAARLDFPFPPGAGPLATGGGSQAGQEPPHRSGPASRPPSRAAPRR